MTLRPLPRSRLDRAVPPLLNGAALIALVPATDDAQWAAKVLPPATADEGFRVVLGPYNTREQAEGIGKKLGRPYWIYHPGQ